MLLTHLHIDHSGGLAPIVFSAFMEGRTDSLTVVGPTARDRQSEPVLRGAVGPDGAWSYMHSFEGFGIRALEASSALDAPMPQVVIDQGDLRVASVSVPHGMMPSVAYRIDHDGASVVFSGDVQTAHAPLVGLAAGCDLLVHDLALPERETEHGHLHAKPSEVGQVARDCIAGGCW